MRRFARSFVMFVAAAALFGGVSHGEFRHHDKPHHPISGTNGNTAWG